MGLLKKYIEDMKFSIDLVSTSKRIGLIKERYNPREVIYIWYGIFDCIVMNKVNYSIATSDLDENAKNNKKSLWEKSCC